MTVLAAEQSAGVLIFAVIAFGGFGVFFLAYGVNFRGWRSAWSKRRMESEVPGQVFAFILATLCLAVVVVAVDALTTR